MPEIKKGMLFFMIKILKADKQNLHDLLYLRMEMLKEVNKLPDEFQFDENFTESTLNYFENSRQSTIISYNDGEPVGCATLCYIELLPTYEHQSGKRAHLMNVYTKKEFRKQGIASTMLYMLIEEAKENGVSEITLDSTEQGSKLYKRYGFVPSNECMVLNFSEVLKKNIENFEKYGCHIHKCGC